METLLYKRPGYTAIPIRDINGRKLHRRLKQGVSGAHCALLALDLERGVVCLHHLPRRAAARLTGANQRDVAALRRASAEELARVRRNQLDLAELRARQTARAPTDVEVDDQVRKLGTDRVLAALDRLTQPPMLVAAE